MNSNQQPQYYVPPGANGPPMPSGATAIYIITFLCLYFPIMAPVVWYLAREELRRIDEGMADPQPRNNVNICRIVGIVMSWIIVAAFAGMILMFVVIGALPLVIEAAR